MNLEQSQDKILKFHPNIFAILRKLDRADAETLMGEFYRVHNAAFLEGSLQFAALTPGTIAPGSFVTFVQAELRRYGAALPPAQGFLDLFREYVKNAKVGFIKVLRHYTHLPLRTSKDIMDEVFTHYVP